MRLILLSRQMCEALVRMCARAGEMEVAQEMAQRMGPNCSVATLRELIAMCVRAGDMHAAAQVISQQAMRALHAVLCTFIV
jgi:hypothetical protein